MLEKITPVILTHNEAPNIGRTLEQLRWARDIVVVDSFSNDETLDIATGFPHVRVFQRKFESFATQCNFALEETQIGTEWVLSLDADYVLTAELIEELKALNPGEDLSGFRASFIYCINGKKLRSGVYPPLTVLFRHVKSHFEDNGHAHRVIVNGKIRNLNSPILHDDRKPLHRWFQAQLRYSQLEARMIYSSEPASLNWTARIRRLRIVAPIAMLFYCLVLRGGVLDGRAGFYYAFQRAVAELVLSLFLLDQDLDSKAKKQIPNSEIPERSS